MELRTGMSSRADAREAVVEAAGAALSRCTSPALALVFSTFDYAPELVAAAAKEALGDVPWAGCATHCILYGRDLVRRGIAIGVVDSDRSRVRIGTGGPLSADTRAAGRAAALEALADLPLAPSDRSRAMILLSDVHGGDAAEALYGARSVAGAGIAWGGGGVSGSESDPRGALYANGGVLHDHVVAIVIDAPARIGASVKHGWQPTGGAAMVTAVTGPLLRRLEHHPALAIYRSVAGFSGKTIGPENFVEFATTHPLGIPQANGEYLIRDPVSVDATGAIRLVSAVPDGALVRVMEGTPVMLAEAARVAASMARHDAGGHLGGAIVFDCISRFTMLGDRLGDELEACEQALGDGVAMLGCLTTGEVGAFGARMPQFHNKTIVVLALPAGP